MPKHQTSKVKARTTRILKAVQDHENMEDVAKELGITRRALSYNMASYDFQSSLAEFLAKDMEEHYATIKRFLDSDDPILQAEGMKEHGKMHRALIPKIIYKKSENENTFRMQFDDSTYNKLSLEEQDKLAEILIKLDDESKTQQRIQPPEPVFVEGEYEIKDDQDEGVVENEDNPTN